MTLKPSLFQPGSAPRRLVAFQFRVLPAVYFYDEFILKAYEVNNVGTYRDLSHEICNLTIGAYVFHNVLSASVMKLVFPEGPWRDLVVLLMNFVGAPPS